MPYLIAAAAIAGITYTAATVAVTFSSDYATVGQLVQTVIG